MKKWMVALAAAALMAGGRCAADGTSAVRRVQMPPRNVRGAANLQVLGPWDTAAWVWGPARDLPPGGEFLRFRRTFEADGVASLRFHVTADQRFVLLLDGEVVARGPDRGAPDLWFVQSYETFLSKGTHCLEAVCWRMGAQQAPLAQLTVKPGFLFKAEGAYDKTLTTGVAPWQVAPLVGTRMGDGKYPMGGVGAQCEVRGTGLESERPDDAAYGPVRVVRGPIRPNPSGSLRAAGWLLYPSELPAQVARQVRPGAFKAADGQAFATNGVWSAVARTHCSNGWYRASAASHPAVDAANALLREGRHMAVPARTRLRLLWDLGDYYCAYPELRVSGGAGARLGWSWAESLYTGDAFDWHTVVTGKERKGQTRRSQWADKYFYGPRDTFVSDGRERALFSIPWWRCGRWCQIEVETGDDPIELEGLRLVETRYPLEDESSFDCDDRTLADVRRICRRGLQMCMHEMHFDCPHYEQQMYGGDTRIQMLIANALTSDARLTRQAFRLFEISQRDNGAVSMNYPTTWLQESSTFSLFWSLMLGDYSLWHDDVPWVRARMPAVRKLLFGLEAHVGPDGLVRNLPGLSFIDWVPEWPTGTPPGGGYGEDGSSVVNCLYLLALRSAAQVEGSLGERDLAARWMARADSLAAAIRRAFWCAARGMLADTAAKDSFSEHAQCLAILSGALDAAQEDAAFAGLVSAPDLTRCTVSFSHYLFDALVRMGRTDILLKRLDLWRDMVRLDLKTPIEGPGDARSDCHAWGSHPLYHLQTGVAGVRPDAAGYRRVRVAPQPGGLRWIRSRVPTPKGPVFEDLRFADGNAVGTVTLPEGLTGVFVWKGVETPLVGGVNRIGDDGLPPLAGDGVTDDTAAIQARLDAGTSCVYLPPPKRHYLISKTLRIGSDTELRLDRFSVVRLAPGSDCPMVENRGYVGGGDRRIALTGGVWDMANLDQSPNPQQLAHCTPPRAGGLPPRHENGFFFGMAMRFSHVEGLTVKGLTVRNPTSYGLALCRTSYFLVDDITFDYTTCNPIFLNMDGVHLDGWCHHGKITNLRGTCFDDMVALNANDGQCAQEEGDITDVDIDGIYADYCHSAVRLLSTGASLKRVTVRNVHGNFYTYMVGLTHFFGDRKTRGVFDDIVIRDAFAAKTLSPENIGVHSRTNLPLVWIEGAVDVGRLTVEGLSRDERTVPVATLRVDEPATVRSLTVRDCRMKNRMDEPVPFLDVRGDVGKKTVENVDFEGRWTQTGRHE